MSVKGLDTFFDVLAVIKDPKVYEKRLKNLSEETQKYLDAVASVAGIQNAQDFLSEIETNRTKAKEELENAHKSAVVIRDSAEKYAKEQREYVDSQVTIMDTTTNTLHKQEQNLINRESVLVKKEKLIAEQEVIIEQQLRDLEKALVEVENKKQKLMRVLDD